MRDVTAKISVLVDIARDGSSLPALVRSLDSQTLPVADFEVVWAVDPAATDVRDRVADLVRRRPNMALTETLGADAGGAGDLPGSGEWTSGSPRRATGAPPNSRGTPCSDCTPTR